MVEAMPVVVNDMLSLMSVIRHGVGAMYFGCFCFRGVFALGVCLL